MPSHWSSPELHILTGSSPTGTQFLHGAGCAHAKTYLHPDSDEVTLVSSGEGATSEGEFWECMNSACLDKLPLVFLIEDNGYAISVPVEHQTAGGNITRLLEGFPGLFRIEVDGTDFVASHRALSQAADYVRQGHGPALVHASVIRPYSHSLSDDEKLYKTAAERAAEAERDPVRRMREFLLAEGLATDSDLEQIASEVDREIAEATDRALAAEKPPRSSAADWVFSPDVDPASESFETPAEPQGKADTMVAAINRTLRDEMAHNPRIVVFGQ